MRWMNRQDRTWLLLMDCIASIVYKKDSLALSDS